MANRLVILGRVLAGYALPRVVLTLNLDNNFPQLLFGIFRQGVPLESRVSKGGSPTHIIAY